MLRWQITQGFENWAQGNEDPRVIKITDGGYTKIGEMIGSNASYDIAKIKAILHAQAFGNFVYADGSKGNMIALNILSKYRNKEPSKINIILGDALLPNYVFSLEKKDRRLIPIGDLPPLHGSPNTHANQAHLQLLVFEELSNQSDKLAKDGAVIISAEKWGTMAAESGLKLNKIDEIITHWCQPDLFNCFLDRQGDEFKLASHYDKAQNFLIDQGNNRLLNSAKGKASAMKKKKGKSKKN